MRAYQRTLIFTVLVPGTFAAAIPWWIGTAPPGLLPFDRPLALGAWRLAGWPFLLAGIAGYLLCGFHFAIVGDGTPLPLDPPKHFVAVGLYRRVRNPMYVAVGLILIGQALLYERASLLLYLAVLWSVFHLFVVLYEEPHLRAVFGSEYADYCVRVPRWVPRLR